MKKVYTNSFTLLGLNNTIAVLKSNLFQIHKIDILENGRANKSIELQNLIKNKKFNLMNKNQFNQKYYEGKSQGVAICFSGEIIKKDLPALTNKKNACLLVLDQIEDPQNLGQIIRTAECAGVDGIIIPKHNSAPINETSLQVSQGAFTSINIYEVTNLRNTFQEYKSIGFWVIGVENSINTKLWFETEYKGKVLIVLGSEGRGIRKKVLESCDFIATIPMIGKTNSLNVSATASAILFERIRQIEGE
jgi:23S rRNA (guanosine2251-2'-O)-methyltransferase